MNGNLELTLLLSTLQNPCTTLKIDPAMDWPLFYKLVLRHRVWHQVYNAFKNSKADIPILDSLAQRCQGDKRRIFITAGETVRIAQEFTKQTIEHCFVKGTLLNMHIYGGLETRPCRDIDVWVNLDTYQTAVAVLHSLGYIKQLPGYELIGFKKSYYMRHKHDMAFYHPERKIIVELHFRLSYFGINYFPLKDVPLKPISLFNVPIQAPDDDYHLLYLMLHGAIHAWIRLRWLQDIALFIQSNRCDLNRVYELATKINCQHLVEQSLILVNDLFTLSNPVLNKIIEKPSHRGLELARIAHQFIDANYEMIDGLKNLNMFFKYRIYLAKLAISGQKIHAIFGDLFKLDELFSYITFPNKLSFMYYLVYPIWVTKFVFKFTTPRRSLQNES